MAHTVQQTITAFLDAGPFAVVGASVDRSKYGNKVLRCYQQHGREVYPINARATEVEGLKAYPSLAALPEAVQKVLRSISRSPISRSLFMVGATKPWMVLSASPA